MAPSLAHDAFGIKEEGAVEVRVIEKFDVLTDEGQVPEDGDWQDMVFALPKK